VFVFPSSIAFFVVLILFLSLALSSLDCYLANALSLQRQSNDVFSATTVTATATATAAITTTKQTQKWTTETPKKRKKDKAKVMQK
jgi:uncharacterized membrane protein